jgi:hypothetical protein
MRLALAFALLPAYLTNARDGAGFFDGYDNPSACMVVLFSALIGLAISTVYSYGLLIRMRNGTFLPSRTLRFAT